MLLQVLSLLLHRYCHDDAMPWGALLLHVSCCRTQLHSASVLFPPSFPPVCRKEQGGRQGLPVPTVVEAVGTTTSSSSRRAPSWMELSALHCGTSCFILVSHHECFNFPLFVPFPIEFQVGHSHCHWHCTLRCIAKTHEGLIAFQGSSAAEKDLNFCGPRV